MYRATHSYAAIALLLVIGATLGVQRPARANDTGALIGGLIAGAIVYELLDDDDDYYGRRYYDGYYYPRDYYRAPTYYRSYPRYYAPRGGVTVWYEDCGRSRGGYYRDYGYGRSYGDGWKARSHAKRKVGPPPRYRKYGKQGGGKYGPPRRYYK
jgi:hypothetical protein